MPPTPAPAPVSSAPLASGPAAPPPVVSPVGAKPGPAASAASAADVPGSPAPTRGDATAATGDATATNGDTRPSSVAPDRSESRSKAESDRRAHQRGRTWGYVSIAMGSIGALLAVGTSILMIDELDQRNKGCNSDKVCTADGISANTSLSQLAPWNVGSWIVTVGSFAAGAYLLVANPPDDRSKDSARITGVGVTALGSGAGLSARGSF